MDQTPALSTLTTLRVGGVPERVVQPETTEELARVAREVWASGDNWLLLGGGSNTVASDDGFDGTVIRIATRGIERIPAHGVVRLRVQAGESWDGLVAHTVREGWSGIEALSGIPGLVGAAPVQNIGAYGQELSSTLVAVDFLDFATGDVRRMSAAELELGYRTSVFKQGLAGIVLTVELDLAENDDVTGAALSRPVAYAQLADELGVTIGTRVPAVELRRAVLRLRASKGMILDAADPDSVSAGSFFTNPIVSENFARSLPADAPRWPMTPAEPDVVTALAAAGAAGEQTGAGVAGAPAGSAVGGLAGGLAHGPYAVKLSAAWLIESAGIHRGFALPGSSAAISSKHTLALTNRGGATAAEIVQLAGYVQSRVQSEFGVILQPEPVLVGLTL
ncbi:MAG: UDP-N-acetylmuramate dehydrogenase [Microbacteriaceae bacterium]|jgi:UDP-N-acetylmuramate dehydrogenase|nr:UDP-N-acetylmuramate dehydrogenase [Microbacteriaceae bacterium]